eukprot:jgi/Chrzof1/12138/Cz06g22180.t1
MVNENEIICTCASKCKSDTLHAQVATLQQLNTTWRAVVSWLQAQVKSQKGANIPGLGKILWQLQSDGKSPPVVFVLSDALLRTHHLQIGHGIARCPNVKDQLHGCEEVNASKLAYRYSSGISNDTIAICLRLIMKGVNDTLQDGQPVMLNLGVGSLSLRGGTATYSWNQSVLRGTAGGGQSSRNVSNEEPVQPAKLTTEALSQLQADIQHSGSRSTVSRVSKAASGVSKAGSRVSQASRVTAAGAKDSSQPQNALALEPDSRYSEPPAAMNVAAMQQCVMDARQAAKANARVKTATFILPVGPDDDAEPRMRQGKGKPEPASNTLVGANQVLLMAEARRKTEQQKQEMQEQELSNKMEQTKALLNEQAKMMLQDKQRQKQLLVADLKEQMQHRLATTKSMEEANAGRDMVSLGVPDRVATAAQRLQRQAQYRADLERQIQEQQEAKQKHQQREKVQEAGMLQVRTQSIH